MHIDSLAAMTESRLRTIETGASVRAAAETLATGDAGLVIVREPRGTAVGVISKSDLVRHLARSGSAKAGAAGLMTQDLFSCRPGDDIRAVWKEMTARRLQNLPVLDGAAKPIGILDVRDVMRAILAREELEEQALADYIAGVGYR
ncbi:CBS domain-containing protein [Amaricoccus sp.]|uniref:CBS domain-containing protein n=1 Tax=Amaricoccus sp. TaxID=1872485 RepID=UPI001B3D4EA5|nr:CBS domain-containing protein [Amaricoccus sp.]MBP7242448.1 CBS domain-containing protein [Amaricoccus sp.]